MRFWYLEKDRVLSPEMLNTLRMGDLSLRGVFEKVKIRFIKQWVTVYISSIL